MKIKTILCLIFMSLTGKVFAQPTVVTSLSEFQMEIGAVGTVLDTFDNDIAGGVSIALESGVIATLSGGNLADAASENVVEGGQYQGRVTMDGVNGALLLTFTFPSPIIGFAAEFDSVNEIDVSFNGGGVFFDVAQEFGGNPGVFGLVDLANPTSSVQFAIFDDIGQNGSDEFNIDNLTFAGTPGEVTRCAPDAGVPRTADVNDDGIDDWFLKVLDVEGFENRFHLWCVDVDGLNHNDDPANNPADEAFVVFFDGEFACSACLFKGGFNAYATEFGGGDDFTFVWLNADDSAGGLGDLNDDDQDGLLDALIYTFDPSSLQVRIVHSEGGVVEDGRIVGGFIIADTGFFDAPTDPFDLTNLGRDLLAGGTIGVSPDLDDPICSLAPTDENSEALAGQSSESLVSVEIDVRPFSRRNIVRSKSHGLLPVAILGSSDFDVKSVGADSIKFGPEHATPYYRRGYVTDINWDGYDDAIFLFLTRGTGIKAGDRSVCLTGITKDGRAIDGCDKIRVRGGKRKRW